ncbi:MAG: zinc-ribbon domain-containing protein [Candidatus Odinarchaeota archaeon]|nr:zinc-ribbon domain-containing protein [Candidatus Odinarchaeota archaeon]
MFNFFGHEKDEKKEGKTRKVSDTIYYNLYKKTVTRFFPQISSYKYNQVREMILQHYFPNVLKIRKVSLNTLFSTFPIPLVFITPRKKAIALFSIYNGAIAEEVFFHSPPAKYDELGRYINVSPIDLMQYVKGRLLIYKTITPFRIVAGMPVKAGNRGTKSNIRVIDDQILLKIEPYTLPSTFFADIYNLAKKGGVEVAVRFTYTLVHTSDNLSKVIRGNGNPQKIREILEYLLNRKEKLLLDAVSPKTKPKDIDVLPVKSFSKVKKISSASSNITILTSKTRQQEIKLNFCPRCGTRLPPNAKFCPNCGLKLQ